VKAREEKEAEERMRIARKRRYESATLLQLSISKCLTTDVSCVF
jgi:hypothetical protein